MIIWQDICKLYIQSSPEEMEIWQNFLNRYIYLYFLSLVHLTNKVVGERFKCETDESLQFALRHFSGAPEPAEPFQPYCAVPHSEKLLLFLLQPQKEQFYLISSPNCPRKWTEEPRLTSFSACPLILSWLSLSWILPGKVLCVCKIHIFLQGLVQ